MNFKTEKMHEYNAEAVQHEQEVMKKAAVTTREVTS